LLGVVQQIGAQIGPSNQVLAGQLVFLLILVVRPQGLTGRRSTA
jgi:branched-chain amino acid transport system permease protein